MPRVAAGRAAARGYPLLVPFKFAELGAVLAALSGMGIAGGAWCMVTMIALAGFLPAH